MKNYIILGGLIAGLLVFIYFQNERLNTEVKRAEVAEDNTLQLLDSVNDKMIKIVTRNVAKEIKEHFAGVDSLLKANNIKANKVEHFTTINQTYIDTTTKKVHVVYKDKFKKDFEWSYADSCFSVAGMYFNGEVLVTDRAYNNKTLIIDYKKKKRILWGAMPHPWKHSYFRQSISNCGETSTQKITFIKKKDL